MANVDFHVDENDLRPLSPILFLQAPHCPNSFVVGMVLMDLSKAYDCIPHDFLIAKLVAY